MHTNVTNAVGVALAGMPNATALDDPMQRCGGCQEAMIYW